MSSSATLPIPKKKRSYYSNSFEGFLKDDELKIFGELSQNHNYALEDLQKNSWLYQIKLFKSLLHKFKAGQIYFEFSIPRMGKRVDNILIIDDLIFVLEFKVGESTFPKHAIEQVVDYSLDLKNFHEGSHKEKVVPILVSTKAESFENRLEMIDNLFEPIRANASDLYAIIENILENYKGKTIDYLAWENSVYKPTPTIIEASQALYRGHRVEEISRNDAEAKNLSVTTECIIDIIETSKTNGRKSICFLTGVPGAGKTLAGLNIANERRKAHKDENAVFLSGNGPLVYVLREALIRDEVKTAKESKIKLTKKQSAIKANTFIQNIHHFRDDNLSSDAAPSEKVVVFDEAQRAWTKEKLASFMKQKGIELEVSEPDFLISVMDRHATACTIVCLIGGGQEINTGEAGISEWVKTLKDKFRDWDIYFSNLITADKNYLRDANLIDWLNANGIKKDDLHLDISIRSFRSEKISRLVHEIIEGNAASAREILNSTQHLYPIYLTRDLVRAKKWLRSKALGSERVGLVGSSGGKRLKPLGIDVKNEIVAEIWFLNDSDDVRSSHYLEAVATEFDIQGLEIDYTCVAWDINFYFKNNQWNYQNFEGTKWEGMSEIDKSYLRNAYRVLLTRARQGMIIFIPEGDNEDKTRPKELYNSTFDFFIQCGFKVY